MPPQRATGNRAQKQIRSGAQISIEHTLTSSSAADYPVLPLAMYTDFAAASWPQSVQGLGTSVDGTGQLRPGSELLQAKYAFALSASVQEAAIPTALMRVPRCSHADLLQQVQAAHHVAIAPIGTLCSPEGVLGFALKLQGVDIQQPLVFLDCGVWLQQVTTTYRTRQHQSSGESDASSSSHQRDPVGDATAAAIFDDLLGGGDFDIDQLVGQTGPAASPDARSDPATGACGIGTWSAWHEAWATVVAILELTGKRGTCALANVKHCMYPILQAMKGHGWPTVDTAGSGGSLTWTVELPLVRGAFLTSPFPAEWVLDVSVAAWLLNEDASVEDASSFSLSDCMQKHCPARQLSQTPSDRGDITEHLDMLLCLGPVLRAKLRRFGMSGTYDSIAGQLTPILASMELEGICFDPDVCRVAESTIQKRLGSLERKAHECAGQVFMITSSKECARVLYEDLQLTATEGRRWNPAQPKKMHKSTAEGMLLQLAGQHPLPVYILAHRKLSKVLNGFVTPLLKLGVPLDVKRHEEQLNSLENSWKLAGSRVPCQVQFAPPRAGIQRIFTQLNQTSTGTGRLSSSNPNLQNLPKRSLIPVSAATGATPVLGDGSASVQGGTSGHSQGGYMHLLEPLVDGACVEIRSAFKSLSETSILLAVDYSQVEMRVLAHCCGDAALIEVFNAAAKTSTGGGSDVYKRLASNVFHVHVDEVTAPQRSQAKTVALGLVYGLGAQELSRKLGVSPSEASEIQGIFMKTYPGIKRFIFAARKFAAKHGFVVTLSGRRRHLPDINSQHAGKRTYAERQAVNSIIQGSAADLIACAMIRLSQRTVQARRWLQTQVGLAAGDSHALEMQSLAKSRLLLQIHDELLCECPKDLQLCRSFVRCLRQVMEQEAVQHLAEVAEKARGQLLQAQPVGAPCISPADLSSILGAQAALQVPLTTTAQVGGDWGTMLAVESSSS